MPSPQAGPEDALVESQRTADGGQPEKSGCLVRSHLASKSVPCDFPSQASAGNGANWRYRSQERQSYLRYCRWIAQKTARSCLHFWTKVLALQQEKNGCSGNKPPSAATLRHPGHDFGDSSTIPPPSNRSMFLSDQKVQLAALASSVRFKEASTMTSQAENEIKKTPPRAQQDARGAGSGEWPSRSASTSPSILAAFLKETLLQSGSAEQLRVICHSSANHTLGSETP